MLLASAARAADYPPPQHGDWVAHDFRFHTGETMPELKLHYLTIGAPSGQPVLILHGTAQTASAMLTPDFAGELFGPGQPLDASKYLHDHPGRDRHRRVLETVGRHARRVPALRLRRHGRRAAPAADGGARGHSICAW